MATHLCSHQWNDGPQQPQPDRGQLGKLLNAMERLPLRQQIEAAQHFLQHARRSDDLSDLDQRQPGGRRQLGGREQRLSWLLLEFDRGLLRHRCCRRHQHVPHRDQQPVSDSRSLGRRQHAEACPLRDHRRRPSCSFDQRAKVASREYSRRSDQQCGSGDRHVHNPGRRSAWLHLHPAEVMRRIAAHLSNRCVPDPHFRAARGIFRAILPTRERRETTMKTLTSKILVSLFTLLTAIGAGAQNRYQTFPLGSGNNFGSVTALNDSGQVLGWWGTNGEAFIIVPGTGWTKNIVKTNGGGLQMNNAATIIGQESPSNRAFSKLWGQPAQLISIYSGVTANAINTAGYIVGTASGEIPPKRQTWVYLMNPQGSTTYIKCPHNSGPPWNEDGNGAEVTGLNNSNQIVGSWDDYSTPRSGFFFDGKKLNITFNMPGAVTTQPTAINDNEEVVGNWIDQNGVQHGFYWNPTAGFSNIDVTGDTAMGLVGINNSSVILGWWQDDNSPMLRHYVTLVNGQPTASIHVPNSLPGGMFATAINNAGQVAGWYATQDYIFRGFLYTPSK